MEGIRGVDFLISPKLKDCISEVKGESDRIATLKLKIHQTNLNLIQAYSPTVASTEEEIKKFYDFLQDTFLKIKQNTKSKKKKSWRR